MISPYDEALSILEGNDVEASQRFIDRGISELKDRLERVTQHVPLVHAVRDILASFEIQHQLFLPREDRYALLAFHALLRCLHYEKTLYEQAMQNVKPYLLEHPKS